MDQMLLWGNCVGILVGGMGEFNAIANIIEY